MNNKYNKDYKTRRLYGIPDKDYFFDNWFVIFLLLMFFPLFGIILLLRKISLHRRNLFKAGNTAIGFGIFLISFGLLYQTVIIDAYITPIELEIIIGLMIFHYITGTISLIIGILTKLKANRYRKYISLIVNYRTNDLTEISNKMKLSRKRVLKDLDTLISQRYLERYIISLEQNKIYLPEELYEQHLKEKEEQEYREKYTRPVQCHNCGANNLLKERIGRCEYCNSYLK